MAETRLSPQLIKTGSNSGLRITANTISLDTSSTHFITGSTKVLDVKGIVSSSTQFTSLTAPFTGSFTGSHFGPLTGTASVAQSSSVAVSSSFATTASFALNASSGAGFPYSGNAIITGSLLVSGSGNALQVSGSASVRDNFVVNGSTLVADAGLNRVGIGTPTPSNTLHVLGNVSASSYTSSVVNAVGFVGTGSWAQSSSIAISSSYVQPSGLPAGTVSSSTQFRTLTDPFTGSFTGSFTGAFTGTGSWAQSASRAVSASYVLPSGLPVGTVSASTQFISLTDPFTGSFTGSFRGPLTGTSSWAQSASSVLSSSYVSPSGLPVGTVSSSTQFRTLTDPFTGSFTGSFVGPLSGTSSWAQSSSVSITASYALASAGGGSVTINNNTDNYVVTATGTANTLNGEPLLQFDSTTPRLLVSGSISSSGNMFIRSGSTLLIGGTATKQIAGGAEKVSLQTVGTNDVMVWSGLTTDTEGRFLISANGFTEWGAGGTSDQDIALFRSATGSIGIQSFNTSSLSTFAVYTSQSTEVFAVDTQLARRRVRINNAGGSATLDVKGTSGLTAFRIEHAATSDIGFSTFVTGDSFIRFYFAPNGEMYWGPGTAVADIGLYRNTTRNLAVQPVGGDSVSTFRVLSSTGAGSTSVFNVDTSNTRVGVGTATPTHTLQVVGDISSSGLIARTVTSSVSPVYNVKAYGATGNGTTDDYTAISASLSAITTAGGGTLYLPKGNYRIGTGLRITSNTNIKGDGRQNTIINCNHLTSLPGTAMISGSDVDNIIIEDLCLSGSGINGSNSIGIRIGLTAATNNSHIILRNLFINDQAGSGVSLNTPILTTIQNVKVRFTAGDGFSVSNGTSTNFYECYAVTGLGAGFDLNTMTYCSLNGCASEVYGISYRFTNCSATSLVSCGSESPINRSSTNPGYTGISYRNSEISTGSRVSLYSCYSRDPVTTAPNGHISGSFQTFNFRAQSGSQVLTPVKVYGNSEFVGQLSASAYTSSITNGIGFVGSSSYANSISGYINFTDGLLVTGSTILSSSLTVSGSARISSSLGVNVAPNATIGRIDASNDIVAFSSDQRLKTNIHKITSSLDRIGNLNGFTYNWNELANKLAGYDTYKSYVGVNAQEVQQVQPEAVKLAPFDNDGTDNSISGENYLTVQYEKLVPLLIEAIKELKQEVDELKRKVE